MTQEQYDKLYSLEHGRSYPLFTNALNNKPTGILSRADINILNEVGIDVVHEKYNTCPACVLARRRFLRNLAKAYFEYEKANITKKRERPKKR